MLKKLSAKAIHAHFIKELVRELLLLGFIETPSYREDAPSYVRETKVGKLTLTPEIPITFDHEATINRDRYWLGCFGRFEDPDKAKKFVDCNSYNGKWNFHFGQVKNMENEEGAALAAVDQMITSLSCRVSRLL